MARYLEYEFRLTSDPMLWTVRELDELPEGARKIEVNNGGAIWQTDPNWNVFTKIKSIEDPRDFCTGIRSMRGYNKWHKELIAPIVRIEKLDKKR
jgi:hypothetical protein